jgi:hypothetical protein
VTNIVPRQFTKLTVRGLFITAAIGSGADEGETLPMVEDVIFIGVSPHTYH